MGRFLDENPFRTDQSKQQILQKKIQFRRSGFVKTCDELVRNKSESVKREIRKTKKYYDIKEEREKKEKIRIFWTTEKSSVSVHFSFANFFYIIPAFFTKLLLFKEIKIHHQPALKKKKKKTPPPKKKKKKKKKKKS